MMAAKLAALIVLLGFLGPAAGLLDISNNHGATICSGGWDTPIRRGGHRTCPPSASPNQPPRGPSSPPLAPWLRVGYYNCSCPNTENIVREVVKNATTKNPGIGAGLIRIFFHDCFVRGCDASVLLNSTNRDTELFGLPNLSLRGMEVIDAAKRALKEACPKTQVSCADIVAFSARDASYFLTNRTLDFAMPAGRYDGRVSFANETLQNLPGPFSDLQELKDSFAAKGLSTSDMVTLSGAHSIGRAQCRFFLGRFENRTDAFAEKLREQCRVNTTVMQDLVTPDLLDNQYYKNIDQFVLFESDAVLNSTETIKQVTDFANSGKGLFEREFGEAMVKMSYIGVKTSADGEIRMECSKVNPGYY
ncbi:hypothetical protein ACP70R_005293 [Stipagrostis hirtigluma subsp. patula]